MKKVALYFALSLFLHSSVWAGTTCFIAQEGGSHVLHKEGDCKARISPCSTFKIPLSLNGV